MTQWEYMKTDEVPHSTTLNEYGKDGWEYVGRDDGWLIFKRPIEENPQQHNPQQQNENELSWQDVIECSQGVKLKSVNPTVEFTEEGPVVDKTAVTIQFEHQRAKIQFAEALRENSSNTVEFLCDDQDMKGQEVHWYRFN